MEVPISAISSVQKRLVHMLTSFSKPLESKSPPFRKQVSNLFKNRYSRFFTGFAHRRSHESKDFFDGIKRNLLVMASSRVLFGNPQ